MGKLKIVYTKGWFRLHRKCLAEYTETEAKKMYNARKHFVVIIYDGDKPSYYIIFNNKYVCVGYLDDSNRLYLEYEFSEISKGKLFLKEVRYWEYKDDISDEKLTYTRYRFTPEGDFGIEKVDSNNPDIKERMISKSRIDVSVMYEDYPEFGHYGGLIRKERNMKFLEDVCSIK